MRRHAAAVLSTFALLGSACGAGGGTPAEQLESALEDLRDGDFAYEVALDVDNDVLAQAAQDDPSLGQASLFAGSFSMRGVHTGDDSSFTVSVMGQDVFALRLIDEGSEAYVQLGLVDLLEGFGMSREDILAEARTQGLPEGADAMLEALFAGGWIGFENDPEAFEAAAGDDFEAEYGDPAALREAFGPLVERFSDPSAFIEQYGTVTSADAVDGLEVLEVELRLRSLLGDLARDVAEAMRSQDDPAFSDLGADLDDLEAMVAEGLSDVPESVAGLTVGLRDGEVERLTFDLGRAAASAGQSGIAPGAALLLVTFERDGVEPVTKPEADRFFTAEELARLFAGAAGGA